MRRPAVGFKVNALYTPCLMQQNPYRAFLDRFLCHRRHMRDKTTPGA